MKLFLASEGASDYSKDLIVHVWFGVFETFRVQKHVNISCSSKHDIFNSLMQILSLKFMVHAFDAYKDAQMHFLITSNTPK